MSHAISFSRLHHGGPHAKYGGPQELTVPLETGAPRGTARGPPRGPLCIGWLLLALDLLLLVAKVDAYKPEAIGCQYSLVKINENNKKNYLD